MGSASHDFRARPKGPSFLALLLASLGILGLVVVIFLVSRTSSISPLTESSWQFISDDGEGPHPLLNPRDMATAQMNALRDSVANPQKMEVCFRFASPGNQSNTGPLENFARLVSSPPFHFLRECSEFAVSEPEVSGNQALVVVTVKDDQQSTRTFQFLLVKQTSGKFKDCWMTDGVFPLSLGLP